MENINNPITKLEQSSVTFQIKFALVSVVVKFSASGGDRKNQLNTLIFYSRFIILFDLLLHKQPPLIITNLLLFGFVNALIGVTKQTIGETTFQQIHC